MDSSATLSQSSERTSRFFRENFTGKGPATQKELATSGQIQWSPHVTFPIPQSRTSNAKQPDSLTRIVLTRSYTSPQTSMYLSIFSISYYQKKQVILLYSRVGKPWAALSLQFIFHGKLGLQKIAILMQIDGPATPIWGQDFFHFFLFLNCFSRIHIKVSLGTL